jgi:hypothetical protein
MAHRAGALGDYRKVRVLTEIHEQRMSAPDRVLSGIRA